MKNVMFFVIVSLLFPFTGHTQFKVGIRAGLSTSNLQKETIEESSLKIAIKEAKYGFHFGFFSRVTFSEKVYLQPEVLFNSNRVDFDIDDSGNGLVNKVLNEKYQYLDIPLMAGYKIGALRLEVGPVGHAYLKNKSELFAIKEYSQNFKDFTLGYQAGIGLDIFNLLVDVRYEGNFNDFGEHMNVGEKQIDFSQSPSRWLMTIGYCF